MLTTGFDDPKIRTIVLARLTLSKNLFWQMIGRGTRGLLVKGTSDVFVIDPIRLTDKFSVMEGYFHNIKAPNINEIAIKALDNEIFSEENHPTIDSLPIPVSDGSPMYIDQTVKEDVIHALKTFLGGGNDTGGDNAISADDFVKIVKETQVAYDNKSARWQLSKVADQQQLPDSNHLSFCNQLIKNAEKNLKADLSWLNNQLPQTFNEEEIKKFFTTVQFVEVHAVTTLPAYNAKMTQLMQLMMGSLPEKKAEKETQVNKLSSNQKPENIPQLVKIENESMINAMFFSHDSSLLFGIDRQQGNIKLWDAFNGKEIRMFKHGGWVNSASISMDNRYLLSVGDDNVKIWMVNDGCEYRTFKGGYEEAMLSPNNFNVLMGNRNLFALHRVDSA